MRQAKRAGYRGDGSSIGAEEEEIVAGKSTDTAMTPAMM